MRWRFLDRTSPSEAKFLQETTAAIDKFWAAFKGSQVDIMSVLSGKPGFDLPAWMRKHVKPIDRRIMWEFGPGKNSKHRLVITPEADRELRPLVATLLERAPNLEHWEFYEYRLAESLSVALESVRARIGTDMTDAEVSVSAGAFNCLDVTYRVKDSSARVDAAFVLTESLIGEQYLDQWIGEINVRPWRASLLSRLMGSRGKDEGESRPAEELPQLLASHIEACRLSLPSVPWYQADMENVDWAMLEAKPQEAEDYIGRDDTAIIMSAYPDMLQAVIGDPAFCSDRYSRCGEHFAYLKIESGREFNERLQERKMFQDPLESALAATGTGAVIGGAIGLRYLYIDLALTDLESGVQNIRKILGPTPLPDRAWLQFCDAKLSAEWVGLTPGAPKPPMATDD